MELQNKKTQSFQQWTNKVVPGQSIFHSKFQKFMKNLVLSRSCFSSKWSSGQVKGSSDDRAEFLHQKSDIFCVESKCFWKTLTLSSRNPIFHRRSVCTRKMHFWRLCRNFWVNMEEVHTEITKVMRKFEIFGKKSQNGAPELENAVFSTVNKQGCSWSKYFPL